MDEAKNIQNEALKILDSIIENSENTQITIQDIEQLSINYETGEGPKLESAILKAQSILDDIKVYNLTKRKSDAVEQHDKIDNIIQVITDYKRPVDVIRKEIKETRDEINEMNEKLDDIYNHTLYSLNRIDEVTSYENG